MNRSPETDPNPADGSVDRGATVRIIFGIVAIAVATVAIAWSVTRPPKNERVELTGSWLGNTATVQEDVGSVDLTVVLSAPAPADVVIGFEAEGTASASDDYQLATNSVVIPTGQDRAVLSVRVINDDDISEGRESVRITISAMTNAQVTRPGVFTLVIGDSQTQQRRPTTGRSGVFEPPAPNVPPPPVEANAGQTTSLVGLTHLAAGSSSDSPTVSTEQFESAPDTLILLMVSSASNIDSTAIPTIGGSLEWDLVETSTGNADSTRRASIFRATSGAGGPETATIGFEEVQEVINWIVIEVNEAPTQQNGAAAIAQAGVAAGVDSESSASVELAMLRSDRSITVGAFFLDSHRARAAEGFETIALVGPAQQLLLGLVGESSLVSAEWPTHASWIGVAIEITRQP